MLGERLFGGIMNQANIEEIAKISERIEEAIAELGSFLPTLRDENEAPYQISQPITDRDGSLAEAIARTSAVAKITSTFGKAINADQIPKPRLMSLRSTLETVLNNLGALRNTLATTTQEKGGLQRFNYENFHFLFKNGESIDLKAPFANVWDSADSLLDAFYSVTPIVKPKSGYDFANVTNAISTALTSATEEIGKATTANAELKRQIEKTTKSATDGTSLLDQLKNTAADAQKAKEDAEKNRQSIAEFLGEATERKSSIETILNDARQLDESAKNYQASLSEFQKQLDARNRDFESGKASLSSLIEEFNAQKASIEGTIKRSDAMLAATTITGLASNFSEIMNQLTKELAWSRVAFYVGIFFLAFSAIPLAGFVILPLAAPFLEHLFPGVTALAREVGPQTGQNGWEYLGRVSSRIVILLPAAWLVSFAGIRYSALFRLREHYAYKYSMAVSVEGFKKQAPRYDQEIAALVLEQLAFNPADKMGRARDAKEAKPPGFLTTLVYERLKKQFDRQPEG